MNRLILMFALLLVCLGTATAQESSAERKPFELKMYFNHSLTYYAYGYSPKKQNIVFGAAWDAKRRADFHEIQLSNFMGTRMVIPSSYESKSFGFTARYSYNFAVRLGKRWKPYLGVGLEQTFSGLDSEFLDNNLGLVSHNSFGVNTSLIATAGVQFKITDRLGLEASIPRQLTTWSYSASDIGGQKTDYSNFSPLGNFTEFRLGVSYKF